MDLHKLLPSLFLNVIWAISSDTQSAYFCIDSSSNPTWVIYESTISNEVEIAVEDVDSSTVIVSWVVPENTEID